MASLQEYCEMMSTSQLQALLREEIAGRGRLPEETILLICDVLARREARFPPVKSVLQKLCQAYLE